MARPMISLCMIVKNEERHLPRCLESVRGAIDEIIVVDTGSSDNSIGIADSYGAHIISFPWNGDFSSARNAGLAAATGAWVLFLDADEELSGEDIGQLHHCSTFLEYEGFFLQIHNHINESRQSPAVTVNPILRMFRNRPEHRFRGKIHEQISYAILERNASASFHITTIKIHHYGYVGSVVKEKDKINRNLKLIEQELRDNPDDPYHHYNIAIEYMRLNDSDRALPHLQRSIALLPPDTSYAHLLYKYEARCLLALKRYEEALLACVRAIEAYPDYTDLHHLKGIIHLAQGEKMQAMTAFAQAIEQGPASAHYHTEYGMGTSLTCYALGQLSEESDDEASAILWYTEAYLHNPSMMEPFMRIIRLLKCSQLETEISRLLLEKVRIDSPDAMIKAVKALLEESCFQAAADLRSRLQAEASVPDLSVDELKRDIWSGPECEIKSAYFDDRAFEALRRFKQWRQSYQASADPAPYEAYRMSRTWLAMADAQLNRQKPASLCRLLFKSARQRLPLSRALKE